MMGFGWGFGGVGMLFMIFFWVFIVVLAIWLVSRLFPGASANQQTRHGDDEGSSRALEIVRERYARGEISKAEYDEMRRGLQN